MGRRAVVELVDRGHEVRQLSRRAPTEMAPRAAHFPIDLRTGAGLDRALSGVQAVVDTAHSMASFRGPRKVLVEGTRRPSAAGAAAGVEHHVLRSIVGIDDRADRV